MFTKKIRHISIEEMNKIIKHADAYSNIVVGFSYEKRMSSSEHCNHSLTTHSYLKAHDVNVEFTTRYGTNEFKPCTYICKLDGEIEVDKNGMLSYRTMRQYYKEDRVEDYPELKAKMPMQKKKESYLYSAGPVVGFNKNYDCTRHEVYEYDINSAYSTQMMKVIPDISTYRFYDTVKKGEVGFLLQEGLPLVPEGYQGDVVMKLIDSPYKKFVAEYYGKKEHASKQIELAKAKNDLEAIKLWKIEKTKAKDTLNCAVGYLQKHNPFIRAWIVHNCNKLIESLIDENTCMWNTDAIYSLVPRPELELGNNIGQWKLEYCKDFAQKGNTYQKGNEVSFRHVNKKWFTENYDLLKDPTPTKEQNLYELKGLKIVEKRRKNEI